MALLLCWTAYIWWLFAAVSPAHGTVMRVSVEENSTAELTCPSDSDYRTKAWYRGSYSGSRPPGHLVPIYSFVKASGRFTKEGKVSEMSLNRTTFTLTLSPTRLSHSGYFTCMAYTFSLSAVFFQRDLQVYIQPRIEMTGLDGAIKENDTVTVTCTIQQTSPPLKDGSFTLTWQDDSPIAGVKTSSADQIFTYSVQVQKQVTRANNGQVVACAVTPPLGTRAETNGTINVLHMAADTKPTLSIEPSIPYLSDDVTFTCNADDVMAYPRAFSVSWFKDGRILSSWAASELTHRLKAIRNDTGSYTCSVRNEVGSSGISDLMVTCVNTDPHTDTDSQIMWLLVGIGGASAVFIVIISLLIVFFLRWRRKMITRISMMSTGNIRSYTIPANFSNRECEHGYLDIQADEEILRNPDSNQIYYNTAFPSLE